MECGTTSEAANRLGLSQSAVSRSIASLEAARGGFSLNATGGCCVPQMRPRNSTCVWMRCSKPWKSWTGRRNSSRKRFRSSPRRPMPTAISCITSRVSSKPIHISLWGLRWPPRYGGPRHSRRALRPRISWRRTAA
ncbi:LysR family transcriptional regulator [Celeribacter halophilus]|uniref:LysR family transcriptional regulator n=1 Tax=Celeribacter halophilus TaxID=576117 RepID=UPI003A8D2850